MVFFLAVPTLSLLVQQVKFGSRKSFIYQGKLTAVPVSPPTSQEMIARLVGFDTTSRNSNMPLIDFIRDYLSAHGIESVLTMNDGQTKANLFATLGPAGTGGIALSGHTDVVPVDGQDWSSDPFVPVERDSKLYGRGTCDMKSFIAIALAMVPHFLSRPLKMPVHLAFSYDEEVGCAGVPAMVARFGHDLPRPRIVVVGEPTMMKIVNAHKSMNAYHTEITGLEAHSSNTHKGVSAIMAACELISELQRIAADMRKRGDASGRFDPPYTTLNVGTISGGTALNIVPRECRFDWEFRGLPGQDPGEIAGRLDEFARTHVLPGMRRVFPNANIITTMQGRLASFHSDEGAEAVTLIKKLARQNSTQAVSYMTEAGLFQEAGAPTVICGPGDIAQAHQPDEFIHLEQIEACEAFMRRLADHVHG